MPFIMKRGQTHLRCPRSDGLTLLMGVDMSGFNLEEHQKGFTPVGIRKDVKEAGPLYHGTKANLKTGDFLEAGYASNFGEREKANYIYLSATMDAAIWGAELAIGEGRGRIYIVEPTGAIDDDPNLTDIRFPGNPTRSYRTTMPLRIIGEVSDWESHPPEMIQKMRDRIEALKQQGYGYGVMNA